MKQYIFKTVINYLNNIQKELDRLTDDGWQIIKFEYVKENKNIQKEKSGDLFFILAEKDIKSSNEDHK